MNKRLVQSIALAALALVGLSSCATGRAIDEKFLDSSSGIEYSLVSYHTNQRIQDEARDSRGAVFYDYILPHNGNVFVTLIVDVLNPRQEAAAVPLSEIRLVCDDGKSYEPYLFRETGPTAASLASSFSKTTLSLEPGKRRFLIVYDLPTPSVPDSVRLFGVSLPLQQ